MARYQKLILIVLLAGLPAMYSVAEDQDAEGAKDHPLVSRYLGSTIRDYSVRDFDEYELLTGKLKGEQVYAKKIHLEGKVTSFTYAEPQGRSIVEVLRNYEMAFKQSGFEILYSCKDALCGSGRRFNRPVYWGEDNLRRYLAAKLTRPQGDVYVSLNLQSQGVGYSIDAELDVIEVKPMESGLVTVNSQLLSADIGRTGHVAVYDIHFDAGKSDVKPESDAALKEIAKLLGADPKLRLFVIGHTDNTGDVEMNLALSKRRAMSSFNN